MSKYVFTDDDLKRLKKVLERTVTDETQINYTRSTFVELIARLEASEVIAEAYNGIYPEAAACEAWRKCSGKDSSQETSDKSESEVG